MLHVLYGQNYYMSKFKADLMFIDHQASDIKFKMSSVLHFFSYNHSFFSLNKIHYLKQINFPTFKSNTDSREGK